MPKYAANPEPVQNIKTLADLIAYLRDELGWPISPDTVADDLTFDWSADELRMAGGQAARLQGGTVRQLRPFVPGQPWGIFLVEFADTQVYRTSLRQIVRGLVPNRRRDPALQSWQHENLLFICATADYERFTFAHFKGDQVHRAKLATFGWRKGSAYLRTLIEHNLPYLAWPKDDGADPTAWQSEWARAFDKEPVTRKFFDDFNNAFRRVCNDIANRHSRWSKETVERQAQTLLNRLLFLCFIQRKGWLNCDRQYLVNQFRDYYRQDPTGISFLKDFLQPLFVKLSTKGPQADIPGHDLPFLNGGLFADEYGAEQRDDDVRRHHELKVGNDTFQHIFDDLLEAYNFTVREDTPLDVDVAIDPEMLGKIFESLVLQLEQSEVGGKSSRHDTGSYYTPRPIVHYLCRDALAAWLTDGARTFLSAERGTPPPADQNVRAPQLVNRQSQIENLLALDASQGLDETARATLNSLLTPDQARALADALQELRACDLAVGSGAFPVALLHELVNVARLAETRARGKDPATSDPRWLFDTKTRLIERVLYGVDIQARAIEICKLRLWLSLVVDYPLDVDVDTCEKQSFRDSLKRLPALPNLDFKIRRANSLIDTIHGEPVPLGKLHASDQARVVLNKLTTAKREFYRADAVPEKRKLRFAIYAALAELAQIELTVARNELGLLPDPENAGKVAELDQGQKEMAKVLGQIRDARKMKAADQDEALERIREFFDDEKKPTFVWQLDFAEVFHREKDLGFDIMVANPPYVLFQEGVRDRMTYEFFKKHYVVAAYKIDLYHLFIERGVNLLNERGALAYITPSNFVSNNYAVSLRRFLLTQTHLARLVFFDERVFEAIVHSLVFCAQRCRTSDDETAFLKAEIEGVGLVLHEKQRTRQQDLLTDKCLLVFQEHSGAQPVLKRLSANGQPLGEIASVNFGMQLRDRTEHLEDVIESPAKADLTPFHRPCLTGKDIARYSVTYPKRYCYFNRVAKRGGCWDEATHNARNKILVRQIGLYPDAALDTRGWAVLNTAFMIIPRSTDYDARFLLGVINSTVMRFFWLNTFKDDRKTFPKIKGEYLKLLPICNPTVAEHDALVALVDQILKAKRADGAADTAALEREIDQRVDRLYGLTAEEIKIVEETSR
jgi:hypothetical protein